MVNPYDEQLLISEVKSAIIELAKMKEEYDPGIDPYEILEWMLDEISSGAMGVYQGNSLVQVFDVDLLDHFGRDYWEYTLKMLGLDVSVDQYIEDVYTGNEALDGQSAVELEDDINEFIQPLNDAISDAGLPGAVYIGHTEGGGDLGLIYAVDAGDLP